MNNDYKDFVHNKIAVPKQLNEQTAMEIKKKLNPDHKVVFVKLLCIQGLIGFLTLLFCPQFNLSLTNHYDLFHYFHYTYGENVCMLICGTIFMGTGAIFAAYLLSWEELKQITKSRLLYYIGITSIIIPIFLIFGAELYLNLFVFWLLGALTSSIALFEVNRLIKAKLLFS